MNVTVEHIKENEDGSADVSITLDSEAREALIRKAFVDCLRSAIEEGRLLNPEKTE